MRKLLIFIFVCMLLINPVFAETGSRALADIYTKTYYTAPAGVAQYHNGTYIRILNTSYNTISKIAINFDNIGGTSFGLESESTYFTCVGNGTCNGIVTYDRYLNNITWYFSGDGAHITGEYLQLDYDHAYEFWRNVTSGGVPGTLKGDSDTPALNEPLYLCSNDPTKTFCNEVVTGKYDVDVSVYVSNSYEITYPASGLFGFTINKSMAEGINTKWRFYDSNNITYNIESSFNTISIPLTIKEYGNGLYANMSLITGRHTDFSINLTGAIIDDEFLPPEIDPITGVGIKFNKDTYSINGIANISWIRQNSTPFGYIDDIYLIQPHQTEKDGGKKILISSPPDVGFIKTNDFPVAGMYEVRFERSIIGLNPQILASDTAYVNPKPASYIIINSTMEAFVPTNITFLNSNDPGALNALVASYYDPVLKEYVSESRWSTDASFGTEVTTSWSCNRITKWSFYIPPDVTRYSDCVVGSVAGYNITRSNLTLSDYSVQFNDIITISYEIDSTNFTNNRTYLSILSPLGDEIYNLSLPKQKEYDQVWVISDSGDYTAHLKVKAGANTVRLIGGRSQILDSHILNVGSVDAEGYGLEIADTFCYKDIKTLKYYSPGKANISFFTEGDTLVKTYPINVSLSGTYLTFSLSPGQYEVKLTAEMGIVKRNAVFSVLSKAECNATAPYVGINGTWTATNEGIQFTCVYWDNWVRMLFNSQGVNNITRGLFALFCVIGIMFFGMIVSKGNFGVGVILGFIPYAFFSLLSFSSPCGEYIPLWISIFIALIIGIKMKWFS